MSRYAEVTVDLIDLDEACTVLAALAVPFERGTSTRPLLARGSLECAGEPVHLRCRAGTLGAVEDFGFRSPGGGGPPALICSDVDRELLAARLLAPLRAAVVERRIRAAAPEGSIVVETHVEPDGTRRIVVRPG